MIKGMTGFGYAQLSKGDIKAIVEIKSLNHRYFDISYYLPVGFSSIENKLRQLVLKHIERGRVTIAIKITHKPQQSVALNKKIVKKYLHFGKSLKKEFNLKDDITVSDLIKLPGVIEAKETLVDPQQVWAALEKCIQQSLKSLVTMRKREGKSLAVDISDKARRMALQIKKIQKSSKSLLRTNKKKMTTEEFQSFQKGCDVNEEISRLLHYIDEIKVLIKSNVAVGKKMDFVAQEMQRETNTIGSKLQTKTASNAVIALKSKIEKIREQAQNVE